MYNSRLQPEEIVDADTTHGYGCAGASRSPYVGATAWDLDLRFYWGTSGSQTSSNNGNLYSETMDTCYGATFANDAAFNQTFAYDYLNRLSTFADNGASNPNQRTFQYDNFGNMVVASASGDMTPNTATPVLSPAKPTLASWYNETTNRLTSVTSFDGVGNQLDSPMICTTCLTYDAENRLTSYTKTSTTFVYDGDGHRVQKVNGTSGITTTYLYDALGVLVAEYTANPQEPACQLCYLSTDHLGSTRMVTDQNGQLVGRHDYLPFGEEISSGFAGRTSRGMWGADFLFATSSRKPS